jgi:hypothetical protein
MKLYVQAVFLALFVSTMVAYGQLACGTTTTPAACPEDSFQLLYASNVTTAAVPNLGDSLINATNTGATQTVTGLLGYAGGNICLNFYVFDPNEEELACCSCMVTPNGLISTSAEDLLSNNLTPENPSSTVIKVLASSATGLTTCVGSAAAVTATNPGAANNLVPGARLWGTTLHTSTGSPTSGFPYGVEREFSHAGATLSAGELNRMVILCGVTAANGSNFGLCKGCNIPNGGI